MDRQKIVEKSHATETIYRFSMIPFNVSLIFFEKLETNLKIDMEVQRPQIDKTILRKSMHC